MVSAPRRNVCTSWPVLLPLCSTMERQVLPGEVVTAKVNARIMSSIPNSKLGNIFVFMDLHVQSLLQYLEGPCVRAKLGLTDTQRSSCLACQGMLCTDEGRQGVEGVALG